MGLSLIPKDVTEAMDEVKRAAQQAQITLAAAHELIANVNAVVLALRTALEKGNQA